MRNVYEVPLERNKLSKNISINHDDAPSAELKAGFDQDDLGWENVGHSSPDCPLDCQELITCG